MIPRFVVFFGDVSSIGDAPVSQQSTVNTHSCSQHKHITSPRDACGGRTRARLWCVLCSITPLVNPLACSCPMIRTRGCGEFVPRLTFSFLQPIHVSLLHNSSCNRQVIEPNAMCLSTVGEGGKPSARFVLMKGYDERGVTWYTNYNRCDNDSLTGRRWCLLWVAATPTRRSMIYRYGN